MCMQSFVVLRIKKALGIFRELITTKTRTTTVALGDPPSGSRNRWYVGTILTLFCFLLAHHMEQSAICSA